MSRIAAIPSELRDRHRIRVMNVEYVHVTTDSGDDLYLTEHGMPVAAHLMPDRFWTDEAWFQANRQRLEGTSIVYRIRTKPVGGRSKDIVLKWNRMGQDIPGATQADDLATAEFNSPFEEFALTMELRKSPTGTGGRVYTHKPLAIYVPAQPVDWDRLGRKRYKLEAKQQLHPEIELQFHRNYAVIYEWTKGIDAAQAWREGLLTNDELAALVVQAERHMRQQGFVVRDNKARHIIVRPSGGRLRTGKGAQLLWAYVDFELLERTPELEREVRATKRRTYLVKQAHRFEAEVPFPSHLHPVRILGVDYVYGHIESTKGGLWVVGKDPDLFDYFLPEKWRKTPRTKLSPAHRVYETTTKDNVRLVWRVSRVAERPAVDPFKEDEQRILEHGYNSPFEEVALAMTLTAHGIRAIYPRAVYMTGERPGVPPGPSDARRYATHAGFRMPDGQPILQEGHDYVIIWGYWNGPDELLAARDDPPYTSINALEALRQGSLDESIYLRLMRRTRRRLAAAGIEDLNLRGTHLVVSLESSGKLALDPDDLPTALICNFELLRGNAPLPR